MRIGAIEANVASCRGSMKAYIFMCSWETYSECISRQLFGVSQKYVMDIKPGDCCFLYQYDLKKLYGIWKATTGCSWHEPEAWGGKYKNQVRVELASGTIKEAPFSQVKHLIEHSGAIIYKLGEEKMLRLTELFR